MTYRQIVSIRLYVRLKGTCSLASRALLSTVNELNSVIINYFNISKNHSGPHKTPYGPCV